MYEDIQACRSPEATKVPQMLQMYSALALFFAHFYPLWKVKPDKREQEQIFFKGNGRGAGTNIKQGVNRWKPGGDESDKWKWQPSHFNGTKPDGQSDYSNALLLSKKI